MGCDGGHHVFLGAVLLEYSHGLKRGEKMPLRFSKSFGQTKTKYKLKQNLTKNKQQKYGFFPLWQSAHVCSLLLRVCMCICVWALVRVFMDQSL